MEELAKKLNNKNLHFTNKLSENIMKQPQLTKFQIHQNLMQKQLENKQKQDIVQ